MSECHDLPVKPGLYHIISHLSQLDTKALHVSKAVSLAFQIRFWQWKSAPPRHCSTVLNKGSAIHSHLDPTWRSAYFILLPSNWDEKWWHLDHLAGNFLSPRSCHEPSRRTAGLPDFGAFLPSIVSLKATSLRKKQWNRRNCQNLININIMKHVKHIEQVGHSKISKSRIQRYSRVHDVHVAPSNRPICFTFPLGVSEPNWGQSRVSHHTCDLWSNWETAAVVIHRNQQQNIRKEIKLQISEWFCVETRLSRVVTCDLWWPVYLVQAAQCKIIFSTHYTTVLKTCIQTYRYI